MKMDMYRIEIFLLIVVTLIITIANYLFILKFYNKKKYDVERINDGDEKDELKKYRDFAVECAKNNMSALLTNGQSEHASILMETMFKYAQKEVLIFGELDPKIYKTDEMKSAIRDFIKKDNTSLKILIDPAGRTKSTLEKLFKNHPICEAIKECSDSTEKLSLKIAGNTKDKKFNHFSIMDAKGFRFETLHDGKRGRYEAFANFNDEKIATILRDGFCFLEKGSEALDSTCKKL